MIGEIKNVVKRKAGKNIYFFGTLTSDKAKVATFVPVIEASDTYLQQNTDQGYQRPGTKSRMNKIKSFISANEHRLIPPVILSARGGWEYFGQGEIGTLKLHKEAAIIDGQHRVGGLVALFEETEKPIEFDFICFADLSVEDEIQEFVTINGEQKGVPKALNAYLKDEDPAKIAWALNEDDDSPFHGRIYRAKSSPETYFALHSVANWTEKTFDNGAFRDLGNEEKIACMKSYWKSIAKHNSKAWRDHGLPKKEHQFKLLELTGFIAWSAVGAQILVRAFDPEHKTFNFEKVDEIVEFVSESFDWSKEGEFQGRTGAAGGRHIAVYLEQALGYFDK